MGKVAVVTGASGGLGQAMCSALAARGYEVVATDVRGTDEVLDVTDPEACRALALRVQPDVWINNAGVLSHGWAADQPDSAIDLAVRVNFLGVINGSRAAVAVMRERCSGHVINVGSMASWMVPVGETVYAATKHAVRAFSVGLAIELKGTGVHVSVLCPNGILTPMITNVLQDDAAAASFNAKPLQPDAVAARAMQLLDKPRLVASIPRATAATARLMGVLPSLNQALSPLLMKMGRAGQQKMRRNP